MLVSSASAYIHLLLWFLCVQVKQSEKCSLSCVVTPLPTAAREVRGCLWVQGLWVVSLCTECVWMCKGSSSATLQGLLYFLVAGAAMSSLPASAPCCVSIRVLQPFPINGEEEHIGNRMSIPDRSGYRRLREVEEGWDDPGNRGKDHR